MPSGWRANLGMCCYVVSGFLLAAAALLPIVSLGIFILWLRIMIAAAVRTGQQSIGAGPLSQFIELPGHDPLGGMALMVAVIGSALVSGLLLTAVILLCIEVLLLVGSLILYLIGRRLRTTR